MHNWEGQRSEAKTCFKSNYLELTLILITMPGKVDCHLHHEKHAI